MTDAHAATATSSKKEVTDLIEESLKMKSFHHPNVLNLLGVCIDAGAAPYLVMPYMLNGSLLSYLRKERPKLTIAEGATEDLVSHSMHGPPYSFVPCITFLLS